MKVAVDSMVYIHCTTKLVLGPDPEASRGLDRSLEKWSWTLTPDRQVTKCALTIDN
jgi:hypothetical protein